MVNTLPLERGLAVYKHEPQTANLTARPWSRDLLTLAVCGKCRKASILRSLTDPYNQQDVNFDFIDYKLFDDESNNH